MKIKLHSAAFAGRAKAALVLLSVTGLLGVTRAASAASLPELMEQGIYSEETKGDIDAAMKLYQQIASEGKDAQSLAAQAQYHLGVCYYKKKDYANATAAFEKVVKDYPDQKDLVARAKEFLAGTNVLLPAPWVDGEELQLDIKLPAGMRIGTAVYSANAGETNGQKIWHVGSHMFAGVQSFSWVDADAGTFKPLHSRWSHPLLGDVDATYLPGHAELKTQGKEEVKKIDLDALVFDNEEAVEMMRRLPLADGYKTSMTVLATLMGNVVPFKIEVTGPEKVTVPAGTFDCFKAELSIRQTFWYSTDEHRYLVKFEAGGVTAELSAIRQRVAGQPVTYQDPSFGFSVTAPAGWVFFHGDDDNPKAKSTVLILDPEAAGTTKLVVGSLDKLKPGQRKSLRDWADSEATEAGKELKDFQVRADSWQPRTVGGRAALSVIADFTEGKDKKVSYGVFSFGETNGLNFSIQMNAKAFDALRPKLDAIIDSFKAN